MVNWIDPLIAHELAFGFLATVFHEPPSEDFIRWLVEDHLFEIWPLESQQPDVLAGLETLREFARDWHSDDLPALKQDYQSLFVGPGRLLAVPWESVYRSKDHLIFDVETMQVRRAYQEFAMPTPWRNVEPDDHIGLEMRFVSYLCALGLRAVQQEDQTALDQVLAATRRFLDEHLLVWGPECLTLVEQHAQSRYYRGCAQLALGCLRHSAEVFGVRVKEAVR